MWYLIRAAVKHVWINLVQLRIKLQIDSQLCDSNFAADVQACLQTSLTLPLIKCPIWFIISIVHNFSTVCQYANFGSFWEIIISRVTLGGRREIKSNSGSLPLIPGGLATLALVWRYIIIWFIVYNSPKSKCKSRGSPSATNNWPSENVTSNISSEKTKTVKRCVFDEFFEEYRPCFFFLFFFFLLTKTCSQTISMDELYLCKPWCPLVWFAWANQ